MANKFFWDYGATDNSEDEDLQSQLYAEIYYAPNGQNAETGAENCARGRISAIDGKEETAKEGSDCQKGTVESKPCDLTHSFKTEVPEQNESADLLTDNKNSVLFSEDVKPDIVLLDAEPVDEKPVVKTACTAAENISEQKAAESMVLDEFYAKDVKPPISNIGQSTLTNSSELCKTENVNASAIVKSEAEAYDEAEKIGTTGTESATTTINDNEDTKPFVGVKTEDELIQSELKQESTESETIEITIEDDNKVKEEQAADILKKYEFSKRFINELYMKKYEQLQQMLQEEEQRREAELVNQQNDHSDENEMDTKYAIIQKHEKEKQTGAKHYEKDREESVNESDSEESILEVPIPPKPQPPVINLHDSDEDIIISSGSDADSECVPLNKINRKRTDREKDDSSSDSSSDSIDNIIITDMNQDIMLHCTQIQKGASSIKEIKQMNKGNTTSMSMGKTNVNKTMNDKGICNKKQPSPKQNVKNVTFAIPNKDCASPKTSRNTNRINVGHNVPTTSNDETLPNKRKQCEDIDQGPSTSKRMKCNNQNENNESNVDEALDSRKRKREETWEEYIFRPMSKKLKAFYSESRGQENFDMAEIRKNMSKDPNMWAILDEDLRPNFNKKRRFWNVRCSNCHHEGHQRYNCDKPRRPPRCYMCGGEGHMETRCPRKMCLTCGKKQTTFRKTCEACRILYCHTCGSVGHKPTECPDLWRRFHQTTRISDINIPHNLKEVMKPANLLVCCNCTKRGHDSSTCKEYRWSQHFPTPSYVTNYTDGPTYAPTTPESQQSQRSMPLSSVQMQQPSEATQSQQPQTRESSEQADVIPIRTNKGHLSTLDMKEYQLIYSWGNFTSRFPPVLFTKQITNMKMHLTGLLEGRITPTFFKEIFQHVSLTFEVSLYYSPPDKLIINIKSSSHLAGKFLYRLTIHWLQLEDDEKQHALMIQLPTDKNSMIELLNAKLHELKEKHDVYVLWPRVKMLKEQIILNKDPMQRIGIMRELSENQSKLVKVYQTYPGISNAAGCINGYIKSLTKSNHWKINVLQFLSILVLYNKLFTCYTPPDNGYAMKGKTNMYKHQIANRASAKETPNNQGRPHTENITNSYPNDTAQLPHNNELRNDDKANLIGDTGDPNSNNDDCVEIISMQIVNKAPNVIEGCSSNQSSTQTANSCTENIKNDKKSGTANNKKKKVKKPDMSRFNILRAFLPTAQQLKAKKRSLMCKARKVLASANEVQIPYTTKALTQVVKKIANGTIEHKDINALQELINITKSRRNNVNFASKYLG